MIGFYAAVAMLGITCVGLASDPKAEASRLYQQGSRAFVERRFDAAIQDLQASLKADPKQPGAIRLLGLTYQLSGMLEEAAVQFQHATSLAPKDAESWFFLGRVQYLQNFFDQARKSLEIAAKQAPADARIHECLALTLEALGENPAARLEHEKAVLLVQGKTGPAATPYLNYGAFLLKNNQLTESEQMLRRAAAAMPGSWQAHFELAKLFHLTDRPDVSLKHLEISLQCERTEEESRRTQGLLANIYARLGREDDSRKAALAAEQ